MERLIEAIVVHSGVSLVCELTAIEMRVVLAPHDRPQLQRRRVLREAVAAHSHQAPPCKALKSFSAQAPANRECAAEGADLGFCATGFAAPASVAFNYTDPNLAVIAGRIAFVRSALTLEGRNDPLERITRAVSDRMDDLSQ